MKRYVVTVDIVLHADSVDMAKSEVRQCLNTGKGHIDTYFIDSAIEQPVKYRT